MGNIRIRFWYPSEHQDTTKMRLVSSVNSMLYNEKSSSMHVQAYESMSWA